MIGDRKYDVVGAARCGLDCIGILYGFGDRTETAALITGLLGRLCEPRLAECIADGTYTAGEAAAVEEGLRCMLPGMLLLYENRLAPDNYEEFMQSVDAQLGRVID